MNKYLEKLTHSFSHTTVSAAQPVGAKINSQPTHGEKIKKELVKGSIIKPLRK
jgi:hypothetical protein